MATADSVKTKIQGLISKANAKTGRSDADMTNAVNALVSGYNPNGITPSGTINITSNGTHNVTNYATANVNVSTGATPTGTISITSNGTYDVAKYAQAAVNVPVPAELMVVRNITIASDMGNGTNTTRTILTADEFVKAHYADDGFFAMLYPVTQIASATNVVHWLHHGNFNTGSTNVVRYGICYYSSSASALATRVMTAKINGNSYNVALRAKSTGNMDLYCESSRIVKAGAYRLVMGCWS